MTVETLETARAIVNEDPTVEAVFEYTHAVTGKKLWSVEHESTLGACLASDLC